MKAKIILFTGLPGCGKTTAADYFQKTKNIPVFRMGDITFSELKKTGLELNWNNEKQIREELRKKFGEEVYAKKIVLKILPELSKYKLIILEGLRTLSELNYFINNLPEVKTVYIDADKKLRLLRLSKRTIRSLSYTQAIIRDADERKYYQLSLLKKRSDLIINNNGEIADFYKKLDEIIK